MKHGPAYQKLARESSDVGNGERGGGERERQGECMSVGPSASAQHQFSAPSSAGTRRQRGGRAVNKVQRRPEQALGERDGERERGSGKGDAAGVMRGNERRRRRRRRKEWREVSLYSQLSRQGDSSCIQGVV